MRIFAASDIRTHGLRAYDCDNQLVSLYVAGDVLATGWDLNHCGYSDIEVY